MSSRPVTTHEYDLLLELRRFSGHGPINVALVVKKIGMSRPRANELLLQWSDCGWYECGRDRFMGSLTPAGRATPIHSKGNRTTHPAAAVSVPALATDGQAVGDMT